MRWVIVFLLVFLIPSSLAVTVTRDCFNCSNCTAAVMASGPDSKVRLMANLSSDGSCIMFTNVTDLTIDCNGFIIAGDGCEDEYGISNYDYRNGAGYITRLKVQDCPYIGGFHYGIWLDRVNNFTLKNISYINNEIFGAYSQQSNLTTFIYNHNINFRNSNLGGLAIFDSIDARVYDSTSVGVNGSGLKISGVLGGNSSKGLIIDNFTGTNNTFSGIQLEGYGHFNAIIKNIISSDNDINGLYGQIDSSIIQNVSARNNGWYGVRLNDTYYTSISDVGIANSAGISIDGGQDIVIWNITILNSNGEGIYLSDNINTSIYDLTLTGSNTGIWERNCTNGSLYDTSISGFTRGLFIQDTHTTKFQNLTLMNNEYGIYFYKASYNNTITNSTIASGAKGVYLDSKVNAFPKDNIVYNNIFNNSYSVVSDHSNNSNIWNITSTPGTNIIGGTWIGGNFWAKSDGKGWSETCIDADGDRFCDGQYDMSTANTDFSALKFYNPTICEGCKDCSNKISAASYNDTIRLKFNITATSQCINMSPNINFSCDGYSVIGLSGDVGILAAENATLKDCEIIGFGTGINLSAANNFNVINTTIKNNDYGIMFDNSSNNTVMNSYIYNNNVGINIEVNTQDNMVYNNLFNNTINVNSSNDNKSNSWNIAPFAGTNIAGGSWIAGNLWLLANGSGWSEMCKYNSTGLCALDYNLSVNNIDYIPLIHLRPKRILLHSPSDSKTKTTKPTMFNWTVDDYTNVTCNLSIGPSAYLFNLTNDTSFAVIKTLSIGLHLWNVTCWSADNVSYQSDTRSVRIIAEPSEESSTSTTTEFYFAPVENSSEVIPPVDNSSDGYEEPVIEKEKIEEIEVPIEKTPKKPETVIYLKKEPKKVAMKEDHIEIEVDDVISGIEADFLDAGQNATLKVEHVDIDLGLNDSIYIFNITVEDIKLEKLEFYFSLDLDVGLNKTIVMSRYVGKWVDLKTEVLRVDDKIYYKAYSEGLSYFGIRVIDDILATELAKRSLNILRIVLSISMFTVMLLLFYFRDRYSHEDVIKTSVGKIDLSILSEKKADKAEEKEEDWKR